MLNIVPGLWVAGAFCSGFQRDFVLLQLFISHVRQISLAMICLRDPTHTLSTAQFWVLVFPVLSPPSTRNRTLFSVRQTAILHYFSFVHIGFLLVFMARQKAVCVERLADKDILYQRL